MENMGLNIPSNNAYENSPRGDLVESIKFIINETINALPEELQRELEVANFEGKMSTRYMSSTENTDLEILGLNKALYTATQIEAFNNVDKNQKTINLAYRNPEKDISVKIKGESDGLNLERPELDISYEGKRYSWSR